MKGSEAWKNTWGHIHSWCKSTDSNDFQAFPAFSRTSKGTKCRKCPIYRKPAQKHYRHSKMPQRLLAVHSQTPTVGRSGLVLPEELQRGAGPGAGRRARGERGCTVLAGHGELLRPAALCLAPRDRSGTRLFRRKVARYCDVHVTVCVDLPATFTSRSIEKSTIVTLAAVF